MYATSEAEVSVPANDAESKNNKSKRMVCCVVVDTSLSVTPYIDEIAKGLSPFNPSQVSIEAGRLMRKRMDALMADGADFAFETTLATRYYTRFIRMAQERGYFVSLLYFWLPTPDQAVERVARRVAEGGHNVPPEVVRRRYYRGIRYLTSLYTKECDYWVIYDNSSVDGVKKIAYGTRDEIREVVDSLSYRQICKL
jgi:predicted ABC-type ATPase